MDIRCLPGWQGKMCYGFLRWPFEILNQDRTDVPTVHATVQKLRPKTERYFKLVIGWKIKNPSQKFPLSILYNRNHSTDIQYNEGKISRCSWMLDLYQRNAHTVLSPKHWSLTSSHRLKQNQVSWAKMWRMGKIQNTQNSEPIPPIGSV